MQTFTTIVAIVAVIGVIWGLIKRYETRLVLLPAASSWHSCPLSR